MCVCRYTRFTDGCTHGLLVESWAHNPEDTGSDAIPGQECNFKIVPPAHPSVKQLPGLVLGSKVYWLCLMDR